MLARLDVPEPDAQQILSVVGAWRSYDARKTDDIVRGTFARHEAGAAVIGGPALKACTSASRLVDELYEIWDDDHDRANRRRLFDELDARYSIVVNKKDAVIVDHQRDPEDGELIVHTFDQFDRVRIKHTVPVNETKRGKVVTTYRQVSVLWRKRPTGQVYERLVMKPHVVVREPGSGEPEVVQMHDDETEYNAWAGYAIEPRQGDWSKLHAHLKTVWCRDDEDDFAYLLDWLAAMVQRPGERVQVAVVVPGAKGVGKGTAIDYIGDIFGRAHFHKASKFPERFNKQLFGKVLFNFNEAFWAGNRDAEARLKEYITDESFEYEGKFENPLYAKNCLHIMVTGNAEWAVNATHDERRYFVLNPDPRHAGDISYFGALQRERQAGGPAAMLYDLLRRPVDFNRVIAGRRTRWLIPQQVNSFTGAERWWFEKLNDGVLIAAEDLPQLLDRLRASGVLPLDAHAGVPADIDEALREDWPARIRKSLLQADYKAFMEAHYASSRVMTEQQLGVFLNSRVPDLVTPRPSGKGKRPRYWALPPLAVCRESWCSRYKWPADYRWEVEAA